MKLSILLCSEIVKFDRFDVEDEPRLALTLIPLESITLDFWIEDLSTIIFVSFLYLYYLKYFLTMEEKASNSRVKRATGMYSFRIEGYSGLNNRVGESTESPEFELCGKYDTLIYFVFIASL